MVFRNNGKACNLKNDKDGKTGKVFESFLNFINLQLIHEWTKFKDEKAKAILKPMNDLLNSSEDFKLNIFSLNYDLIFETSFNTEEEKKLDNGFSEKNVSSEDKVKYWTEDFNDPHSPSKINLYKLHGSIDWLYDKEAEEILINETPSVGGEPMIIFGSFTKMLSFDPFLFILSEFRKLLKEATLCVVIGYSFHDKYINNLLIQQINQNTIEDIPKKLLIIDPFLSSTNEVQFAENLKTIQESKSINDIINFCQISPERIKIIPISTAQFYSKYFSTNASELILELQNAEEGEKPFN